MSQHKSIPLGSALLVVALLMTGSSAIADPEPIVPPGYKLIKVPMGGGTVPILVKQQSDPLSHVNSINSGTFHNPASIFSEHNEMSDKKYAYGSDNFAKRDAAQDGSFATKTYQDPTISSDTRIDTPTARLPSAAGFNHNSKAFDRTYAVASADSQARSTFAGTSTSTLQNRSATLGGTDVTEKKETSTMADKRYTGPGAQNVPAAYAINDHVVLSRMSGIPSRDLSMDEVRELINHGATPDTTVQPEAPSKPLNDPDYQPTPLRAMPALQAHPAEDDKDDPVPGPGMISSPETAEPLPQK